MCPPFSSTGEDTHLEQIAAALGTSSSKNVTFILKREHVWSWVSISGEQHFISAHLHASYFWRTINVFISGKCTKLHGMWKHEQVLETGTLGNMTLPKWVRQGKRGIYIYIYSFF